MMVQWLDNTDDDRRNSVAIVAAEKGMPDRAVEKDWWVTLVLNAIFSTPYREALIFKGGTSLSKGWDLIGRLSEDIDLALDRGVIGSKFNVPVLTTSAMEKLRKGSAEFVLGPFKEAIRASLLRMGLAAERFEIILDKEGNASDPNLLVNYQSLYEVDDNPYLAPRVKIEVSTRSLREPFSNRPIQSFIGAQFPNQAFADAPVDIPTVEPKRTFLEKACLLHEELMRRPVDLIKVFRMSRHLYDLEKIMDTDHGRDALADTELYQNIIDHRRHFYSRGHVDYATLLPGTIDFIPTAEILAAFRQDYNSMAENMFVGEQLTFDEIIFRMGELRGRFRLVQF